MLDAIARHSLWVAIWLSAVAFIDAVLGGIYRASDGANIGGFIPSSLFSALVFVFAVFVTSALKSGDPRALWWSFGALVAGGLRAFVLPFGGSLGDYGAIVFTMSVITVAVVALVRFSGRLKSTGM